MKCDVLFVLLLEMLFVVQTLTQEEAEDYDAESRDLDPEGRKFHHKKKRPNPCNYRSAEPMGKFFDVTYNINYYGGAGPCGGLGLGQYGGHQKPHKPFGGGLFGGGHYGGGGGGLFGGHGGGGYGFHQGGPFGGGFGGHRPGGYGAVFGGYNIKPHRVIKDINKIFHHLF